MKSRDQGSRWKCFALCVLDVVGGMTLSLRPDSHEQLTDVVPGRETSFGDGTMFPPQGACGASVGKVAGSGDVDARGVVDGFFGVGRATTLGAFGGCVLECLCLGWSGRRWVAGLGRLDGSRADDGFGEGASRCMRGLLGGVMRNVGRECGCCRGGTRWGG